MVFAAWRRTTVGKSCQFCLMLATRGAVYTSEDAALYSSAGSRYHDHCDCGVELETQEELAAAIRVDPVDADRIVQIRVKGNDYTYDLSNYYNLGAKPPPPPTLPQPVARTLPLPRAEATAATAATDA